MCTYKQFILNLHSGKISKIRFSIENYAHYKNCAISRLVEELPFNKKVIRIEVKLTADETEKISFYEKFKEDYKLFHLGSKGSFTLKQMWEKVQIIEIE